MKYNCFREGNITVSGVIQQFSGHSNKIISENLFKNVISVNKCYTLYRFVADHHRFQLNLIYVLFVFVLKGFVRCQELNLAAKITITGGRLLASVQDAEDRPTISVADV